MFGDDRKASADLDRHITGNGGEDQLVDGPPDETEDSPESGKQAAREMVETIDITPHPDFLLGFRIAEKLVELGFYEDHVMEMVPALQQILGANRHWYLMELERQNVKTAGTVLLPDPSTIVGQDVEDIPQGDGYGSEDAE